MLPRAPIASLLFPLALMTVNVTLSFSTSCAQAQSKVEDAAIAKARALESRGLTDLAAQTWQQVLLAQPNNTEALAGLARAARKQGNEAQAARLLDRLRQLNPKDPLIAGVDATVSNKVMNAGRAEAEALARQRNYPAAMQLYRQLYGDHPPEDVALEYYDTEAATEGGRAHAIAGLRALVKQQPGNGRYLATLGRVLTYDPKTRPEGEAILQHAPREANAEGALQQALQWDAQKNQPQSGPTGNPAEGQAYAALQANQTDRADQLFRGLLKQKPDDARALAGLGFVHMKQQDFEAAVSNFEAARKHGLKDTTVDSALETARYWRTMGRASKALDHNPPGKEELEQAIELYRQALALNPTGAQLPAALAGLAGTLLRNHQPDDAAEVYSRWVKAQPDSAPAWRGLFLATTQGSQPQQALAISQRFPPAVATALATDPEYLTDLSDAYRAAGEFAEAAGAEEQAIAIFRSQIEAQPENASAWQSLILAQHQTQDDAGAVSTFEQMPRPVYEAASHDPGFLNVLAAALQQQGRSAEAGALFRLLISTDPQRGDAWLGWLSTLHQQGKDAEALATLSSMPQAVGAKLSANPDYLLTVGSIYAATGHSRWALAALARVRAQSAAQPAPRIAGADLQIARLYLQLGEEEDLYATLMNLAGRGDLTDDQRRQVQGIWADWSVRRAGQSVAAGNPRQAMAILHAAQEALSDNPQVSRSLAGAYLAAGDPATSLAIYQTLDLGSAQDYKGALGAALAAHNLKLAESWLRLALEQYPQDAGILGLAARYEQARGDNGNARAYWQASLAHSPATGAGDALARALHTHTAANRGTRPAANTLAELLGPGAKARRANLLPGEAEPATLDSLPPAFADSLPAAPAPLSLRQAPLPEVKAMQIPAPAVTAALTLAEPFIEPLPIDAAPANPPRLDTGGRLTMHYASVEPLLPALPIPQQAALKQGLQQGVTDQQLIDAQLPPLNAHYVPAQPSEALSSRAEAQHEIAAIDGGFTPWVGGMGDVRHRTGQPGFDQLTALEAPFEASSPLGTSARLTFITTPVFLDGGVADGTSTLNFGSLPLGTIQPQQYADGVANEIQLTAINFAARIGQSPYGFLVTNVVGGVRWRPAGGPLTFTFSRDGVKDTQLSYSGLRDPGSATATFDGKIWGGVVANAGDVQIAHGDTLSGFYAGVGGQYITGEHVLTNTRFHGNAGAYWRVVDMPQLGTLVLGANFFGMHYAHNLRYFTYGQGGYFSPEAYFLASMPLSWTGHYGADLHYNVTGTIGAQSFQENSEAFFPLDPGLQAAFGSQKVPVRSSVGSNYDLQTEVAYRIQDHWYVGGFLDFNNTRDYESQSGGFFVRYLFRPQPDSQAGPIGAFPRDGFRPVMMP